MGRDEMMRTAPVMHRSVPRSLRDGKRSNGRSSPNSARSMRPIHLAISGFPGSRPERALQQRPGEAEEVFEEALDTRAGGPGCFVDHRAARGISVDDGIEIGADLT
ncbi:MAG: hypothetical protein P4N59_23700, partial [Negativicutes bacterium]|nr:hypothetical protein [Negativicutes bacterium]